MFAQSELYLFPLSANQILKFALCNLYASRLWVSITFVTICCLSALTGSCGDAFCRKNKTDRHHHHYHNHDCGNKTKKIPIKTSRGDQVKALKALGPLSRARRHMDQRQTEGSAHTQRCEELSHASAVAWVTAA